jgi:hypothetical protein
VCAQTASTGALTGTVTDPTGAVLQSAQITLRNKGTAETRIAITDQADSYRFSAAFGVYGATVFGEQVFNSSRVNQFFDTGAFVPAPFIPDGALIDGKYPVVGGGTIFGNLGRNVLRGPAQRNVDVALIKRTRLGAKANFVFRWEVFNVFNWPNFANPASDVSSPSTFGRISAMSVNPRIMQFALKLEF